MTEHGVIHEHNDNINYQDISERVKEVERMRQELEKMQLELAMAEKGLNALLFRFKEQETV